MFPLGREQRNILHRRWSRPRLKKRIDLRQVVVRDHLRRERRHVAARIPHVRDEARHWDRVGAEARPLRPSLPVVHVALIATVLLVKRCAFVDLRIAGHLYRGPLRSALRRWLLWRRSLWSAIVRVGTLALWLRRGLGRRRGSTRWRLRCGANLRPKANHHCDDEYRHDHEPQRLGDTAISCPSLSFCVSEATSLSRHSSPYLTWVTTSTTAGSPRLTTAIARFSAGPRSAGLSIGPSA